MFIIFKEFENLSVEEKKAFHCAGIRTQVFREKYLSKKNELYNYKHLWIDRRILEYSIKFYKLSVTYLIFYRNGVTQTEMSVI